MNDHIEHIWDDTSPAVTHLLDRAAELTGVDEPARFAALCDAWDVLNTDERRTILACLHAGLHDGQLLTDQQVDTLHLEVFTERCPVKIDLTCHWRHNDTVHVAIDGKARTGAARNWPKLSTAFPDGPDPNITDGHTYKDVLDRWRVCQACAYRHSPAAFPDHYDLADAHWRLVSPDAWYIDEGWGHVDLELVIVALWDAHTDRPRPELEEAIAAHIAPSGTKPFRAYAAATGRTVAYRNFPAGYVWHHHIHDDTVKHIDRLAAVRLTATGWVLEGELGPGDREGWANDLAVAGEQPAWKPCLLGCPTECGHLDNRGLTIDDRPEDAG